LSGVRTSKRGLHIGDGRKAAPAIGTITTEAAGVLDTANKLRADLGSEEPSGRASPIPFGGTRRDSRLRVPVQPHAPTTYGEPLTTYHLSPIHVLIRAL
jgi:phosphoinositide-3-kinase regulatory subunit 4